MTDWFDPFGVSRVADALSTGAAQAMVGRTVRLEQRAMQARIVSVSRAAPANAISTMLSGQVGLWRRLDVTFGEVQVDEQTVSVLRVDADDVRAVQALPQRIRARQLDIHASLTPEEVESWLRVSVSPDVDVRVEGGRFLARLPRLARFGDVELEPRWDGRTVGVDVRFAWVRGRRVSIPDRFQRSYEKALEWLPTGTTIRSIELDDRGGLTVEGTVIDYVLAVDVARLLGDLTAKSTAGAIDVLLGGG
ncbi:MAG: hypothetical protein AAGA37_17725 [Actinomycetota bacterium]